MSTHLSDDEAKRLLRLLALKRHEIPPPGFFDRLPGRILLSIRAGTEVPDRSWWESLWELVRREPMVVGSYAALGVGAALFGVSVFQMALETDPPSNTGFQGLLPPPQPSSVFLSASPHLPQGVIYRVQNAEAEPQWNPSLFVHPPTTVMFRSEINENASLRLSFPR